MAEPRLHTDVDDDVLVEAVEMVKAAGAGFPEKPDRSRYRPIVHQAEPSLSSSYLHYPRVPKSIYSDASSSVSGASSSGSSIIMTPLPAAFRQLEQDTHGHDMEVLTRNNVVVINRNGLYSIPPFDTWASGKSRERQKASRSKLPTTRENVDEISYPNSTTQTASALPRDAEESELPNVALDAITPDKEGRATESTLSGFRLESNYYYPLLTIDEDRSETLERLSIKRAGTPSGNIAADDDKQQRRETGRLSVSENRGNSSDSQLETDSTSTSSANSRQNANSWATVKKTIMKTRREMMIRRILSSLTPWLEAHLRQHAKTLGNNSSPGEGDKTKHTYNQTEVSLVQEGSSRKSGQKRPKRDEDGQLSGNEESDTDREPRGRRPAKRPCAPPDRQLWLACPFYQREPITYQTWRSCSGPGWPTCHRLKEHLYRVHGPPDNQCPRCRMIFKNNEQLEKHARSTDRCDILPEPHVGFSKDQKKQLKSRKKPKDIKTEFDDWTYIYSILFPGEAAPSPFYVQHPANTRNDSLYSSAVVVEIRRHMYTEFSRLMHDQLVPIFDDAMEQRCTKQQIIKLAENVFDEILRDFQQSRSTTTDNPDIMSLKSKKVVYVDSEDSACGSSSRPSGHGTSVNAAPEAAPDTQPDADTFDLIDFDLKMDDFFQDIELSMFRDSSQDLAASAS